VSSDVEIVFTPSGRRGRFAEGISILDAARALQVDLDSVCGGRGICGRCQITVGANPDIPADPARLSPPGPTETDYRGRRVLGEGRRLGCAAHARNDVVIDIPADSQVHRQVVRKDAGVGSLPVDPVVRLHYIEVTQPDLSSPTGDLERTLDSLEAEWGLTGLSVDLAALSALQPALRRGDWAVTVAVRGGTDLVAVWPGFRDSIHGVAFDIGSTTIAGHLCELMAGTVVSSAGRMNPQIGFGEDVMSRVSYIMMNPGGEEHLTSVVREALDEMVGLLCEQGGIDRDDVLEITVVGNPIMHHLVHGLDPRELGTAPFALATTGSITTPASQMGVTAHPGARVYALPCIAGHVGADAAAATLAEGPHRGDAIQLLVDVGTNAEIVLGNRHRLLAASSPTGPAFEGAEISAGQRAAPGAIERVRIDPGTLEARYKVIGSDLWSDDPGFAASVAKIGVTGICGSGIIEVVAEMYLAGIISVDGVIMERHHPRIIANGRTSSYRVCDEPLVEVTQNDVRAIQLAKAALQAGCRLLMDHLGVSEVDEVRLAGAFGSHIDPLHATVLGMIPDCDLEKVKAAGNAAGIGAMMALLSGVARREIEDLTDRIEKIETATEPRFQTEFVAAMGFPNSVHPYPNLATRVHLPTTRAATPTDRPRRRSRRESA
jgi:uncharacterized 2Fe-2S/4Fe-4S cluster protein (DUF4445 family)